MDETDDIQENKRLKRGFVPSRLEFSVLLIGSFLFLLIINSIAYIRIVDNVAYTQIADYAKLRFNETLVFVDGLLGTTVLTLLFWMFVGLVAYIIFWFIWSAFTAYHNDIPLGRRMILPTSADKSRLFRNSIAHFMIRIVAFIFLVMWLYLLFSEILPTLSYSFIESFSDITWLTACKLLAISLGMAASLFVISVLARCVVMKVRVFT